MPQIEVSFDIDANGVVKVSAKDKATNKEQQISIKSSGGLSEAEIQKMMQDAEQNAVADKAKKELIEARNQADSLVYETEKSLKEHGEKVDSETRNQLEQELQKLKDLLVNQQETAENIKKGIESLMQSSAKLGEAIYKTANNSNEAPQDTQSNNKDGKVVDAEYQEVQDKKENN